MRTAVRNAELASRLAPVPITLRLVEFPQEQLSVYVTARRYGSLDSGTTYVDILG